MPLKYIIQPDANGRVSDSGFGLPLSEVLYSVTLGAGAAASVAVPDSAENWLAVIRHIDSAVVWVSTQGTAAVPAGGTLAAIGSQLNPGAILVNKSKTISVISAGTPDVSIAFYKVD